MDILTLRDVSKRFGKCQVIDNLSFTVHEHSIYGFIGENGAGKTTTMKMILGLYRVDSGEIRVCGEKVTYGQNKTNRYIGYLPDVPEFYGYMTPAEYLKLCGEITGISSDKLKTRIPELLELVGLKNVSKRIQGFSRGMKQRLGIAQALLNQPKLLICDEPTSALDPIGRKEILDILLSVREKTTVMFSTHILSDVERICDKVGVLHKGRLVLQGSMEQVRNMGKSNGFQVEFRSTKEAQAFAAIYHGGRLSSGAQLIYEGKNEDDMAFAMKLLYDNNLHPLKLEMMEPTLESLFMEVVGK